jgi:hypothetical protein
MLGVLGRAPKPGNVWEQQFDGNNRELAELAQMDWDKIPDDYFWYYFHDLTYVDLQPDLFRHAFPGCLKYWQETLMRNESAECGDADFHRGLMRGRIAEKMLSEKERRSLHDFFRDGFLDRIEAQCAFPTSGRDPSANGWIGRFNSLGIVAPVVEEIWDAWWRLDNLGKAFSAVMYASGLVYLKGENPIYGDWTREGGGGGPYLAETDCSIFDSAWRDDNLAFLKRTLSVEYVTEKLDHAAKILSNQVEAEKAAQVVRDARRRGDVVEIRIDNLLTNLSKIPPDGELWE